MQAYASYSLKKIYDVNKLDLVKVGKAFGFPVPPRVNLKVGGGQGGSGRTGKKRQRDENNEDEDANEEEWEEIDAKDKVDEDDGAEEEDAQSTVKSRSGGKDRRKEMVGKKKFDKELKYKNGAERKRLKTFGGSQWSR